MFYFLFMSIQYLFCIHIIAMSPQNFLEQLVVVSNHYILFFVYVYTTSFVTSRSTPWARQIVWGTNSKPLTTTWCCCYVRSLFFSFMSVQHHLRCPDHSHDRTKSFCLTVVGLWPLRGTVVVSDHYVLLFIYVNITSFVASISWPWAHKIILSS